MELTVYRQASRTRPDGTVVYKGEDARPYVDDRCFFVADGMGGAASIRHQKIRPEMFREDKLLDTLFSGVYPDYSDERFVKYVTDSFFELFAVRDTYTDNVNNIKKSGYFASRIVTAILLHEFLYNGEDLSPEKIFGYLDSCRDPEKREQFLLACGDYFARHIHQDLDRIAENANLVYESGYAGLALLGTTLCFTLYRETETGVDALYLTAGDSRPYLWTQEQGLCQLLPDQEGRDGGMTNYICANEPFTIRCNFFQFPKPCVLFNASDGCFDAGPFFSQMAYEKEILTAAVESESPEEMGKRLEAYFQDYGRHDDSSTMAMKMLGYGSFGEFQAAARARLDRLEQTYFSQMPDLLDRDYREDPEPAPLTDRLEALKARLRQDPAVRDYCVEQIQTRPTPGYQEQLDRVAQEAAQLRSRGEEAREQVRRVVTENYIRFLSLLEREQGWLEGRRIARLQALDRQRADQAQDYLDALEDRKRRFDQAVEELRRLLEEIYAVGVPQNFEVFDQVNFRMVEDCESSMEALFRFFRELKEKRQEAVKRLAQEKAEYAAKNSKLAAGDPEGVRHVTDRLLAETLDPEELGLPPEDRMALDRGIRDFREAQTQAETVEAEGRQAAFAQAKEAFWQGTQPLEELLTAPDLPLDPDLLGEIRQALEEARDRSGESKAARQQRLLEAYQKGYERYMEEAAQ